MDPNYRYKGAHLKPKIASELEATLTKDTQ